MSWEWRLDALQLLLNRASRPAGRPYLGASVDPDALDPGPLSANRLWKDRGFGVQRAALLGVLADAVDQGGWLVIRPSPRREMAARRPFRTKRRSDHAHRAPRSPPRRGGYIRRPAYDFVHSAKRFTR